MTNTPNETLTRNELIQHLDQLVTDVAPERRYQVLSWTLWGVPPWSSFTNYAGAVYDLLRERHQAELDGDLAHLTLAYLAWARTHLADRYCGLAAEELEDGIRYAASADKATLDRLAWALCVRALFQNGNVDRALIAVAEGRVEKVDRDPPEFRVESVLTLGVAAIVQGDNERAQTLFADALELALGHERTELGAWQAYRARLGGAHAAFRAGDAAGARALAEAAQEAAESADAAPETVDAALLTAAYGLAAGVRPRAETLAAAVSLAAAAREPEAPDFLGGMPAVVAGAPDRYSMRRALERAGIERADLRDGYGWLVCILAHAAIETLGADDMTDATDAVNGIDDGGKNTLDVALRSMGEAGEGPLPEMLRRAQTALARS